MLLERTRVSSTFGIRIHTLTNHLFGFLIISPIRLLNRKSRRCRGHDDTECMHPPRQNRNYPVGASRRGCLS
jgi:hypothetical protein